MPANLPVRFTITLVLRVLYLCVGAFGCVYVYEHRCILTNATMHLCSYVYIDEQFEVAGVSRFLPLSPATPHLFPSLHVGPRV